MKCSKMDPIRRDFEECYSSGATPGYTAPFNNPARCAPLDAAMATVSATLSGTVFRSLKSTSPIASPLCGVTPRMDLIPRCNVGFRLAYAFR